MSDSWFSLSIHAYIVLLFDPVGECTVPFTIDLEFQIKMKVKFLNLRLFWILILLWWGQIGFNPIQQIKSNLYIFPWIYRLCLAKTTHKVEFIKRTNFER